MTLAGLIALSVEISTQRSAPAAAAASTTFAVPITFVCAASRGCVSRTGTCLSAAAWNTISGRYRSHASEILRPSRMSARTTSIGQVSHSAVWMSWRCVSSLSSRMSDAGSNSATCRAISEPIDPPAPVIITRRPVEQPTDRLEVGLHLLSPEQVLDPQVADVAGRDPAPDDLVDRREDAKVDLHLFAEGGDVAHQFARRGRDRQQHLVDLESLGQRGDRRAVCRGRGRRGDGARASEDRRRPRRPGRDRATEWARMSFSTIAPASPAPIRSTRVGLPPRLDGPPPESEEPALEADRPERGDGQPGAEHDGGQGDRPLAVEQEEPAADHDQDEGGDSGQGEPPSLFDARVPPHLPVEAERCSSRGDAARPRSGRGSRSCASSEAGCSPRSAARAAPRYAGKTRARSRSTNGTSRRKRRTMLAARSVSPSRAGTASTSVSTDMWGSTLEVVPSASSSAPGRISTTTRGVVGVHRNRTVLQRELVPERAEPVRGILPSDLEARNVLDDPSEPLRRPGLGALPG